MDEKTIHLEKYLTEIAAKFGTKGFIEISFSLHEKRKSFVWRVVRVSTSSLIERTPENIDANIYYTR